MCLVMLFAAVTSAACDVTVVGEAAQALDINGDANTKVGVTANPIRCTWRVTGPTRGEHLPGVRGRPHQLRSG